MPLLNLMVFPYVSISGKRWSSWEQRLTHIGQVILSTCLLSASPAVGLYIGHKMRHKDSGLCAHSLGISTCLFSRTPNIQSANFIPSCPLTKDRHYSGGRGQAISHSILSDYQVPTVLSTEGISPQCLFRTTPEWSSSRTVLHFQHTPRYSTNWSLNKGPCCSSCCYFLFHSLVTGKTLLTP